MSLVYRAILTCRPNGLHQAHRRFAGCQELLELCQVSTDKTVLNIGCGAGTTTTFIVENYGCHVVGVDIKGNMIESAMSWVERKGVAGKTEFKVADAQDLPFDEGIFDILICESVNIFFPEIVKAFKEYKRVVKPGGVEGLNEPVLSKAPPANAGNYWRILLDMISCPYLGGRIYWRERD